MMLLNFPVAFNVNQYQDSEVVFEAGGVFYRYDKGVLSTKLILADPDCWLSLIRLKGNKLIQATPYKKSAYILDQKGNLLPDYSVLDQIFLNDKYKNIAARISHERNSSGNPRIILTNIVSKTSIKKDITIVCNVVIDSNIYGTLIGSGNEDDYCIKYDFKLEECWRVLETGRQSRMFDSNTPKNLDDSIIYCAGSDLGTTLGDQNCFKVIARYKDTGDLKWQAGFTKYVHSLSLVGNRVYLAHETEMVILDANTGGIIMRKQSGFKNEGYNKIRCIDDKVFFQNTLCNQFKVFDEKNLNTVANIDIPLPYAASPNHGPEKIGGMIYWNLRSNEPSAFDVHHGCLIIDPVELGVSDSYNIELEDKPNIQTQCLQNEEGIDYYQIIVTGENFDDVLRFSEIEVKYVAAMYGTQVYTSGKVNKNFGGKIILKINKDSLNNPDDEKFNILNKRLDIQLEEFYSAGNKQDRCRCQCEWV
jgi:hypothetical protein